jgi:hypothetical protein
MATRPTVTDLIRFKNLQRTPSGDELTVLTEALETALEVVEERLKPDVIPEDPSAYPQRVRSAVLIQANRFAVRPRTPEGVGTFGDAVAMRLAKVDPDVELLLLGLDRLDGFA